VRWEELGILRGRKKEGITVELNKRHRKNRTYLAINGRIIKGRKIESRKLRVNGNRKEQDLE